MSSKILPKDTLTDLRLAELVDLAGPKPRNLPRRPAESEQAAQAPRPPDPALLEQARQEGFREGVDAGRQEAEASLDSERTALRELSDSVNRLMADLEQGLAKDVLSMSLELAKLIVRHSLKVKPNLVLSVVREAASSLPGVDEQTTLHLHPSDAVLLRKISESDKKLAALPWKIVEDLQIERGGCRLDTATTEVDATLETRWRRVIAALDRDDRWIDSGS